MKQHRRITIDFSHYFKGQYDLAVPVHLPLKTLLPLIIESLDLQLMTQPTKVKVTTKHYLLTENDRLIDFQISDGDILKVL